MASRREQRVYTPEEYLALEHDAPYKSEYYDGRIYAMTGASANHSRIAGNVLVSLHTQLRGRRCDVFTNDIRVRVRRTGLYTYPDVSALCGEPQFVPGKTHTLLNPNVIVEVLSPSTESYDRGDKFGHYRQIPSLQEYVLFAQDRMSAERYVRDGDTGARWGLTVLDGPDAIVELPSVGCALLLRDVYERVEFPRERPLRAVYEDADDPSMFFYPSPALRTPAASSP